MKSEFGEYQTCIRLTGRSVIGIGHTPAESRRNAFDAIEARNPDLTGFCAVMKTMKGNPERVSEGRRA